MASVSVRRRAGKGHKLDAARLCDSVAYSYDQLEHMRKERTKAIERAAGSHYADRPGAPEQPVNFIGQFTNLASRSLVADNPATMLSTMNQAARDGVALAEEWINRELVRMNVADPLHRATLDALYCFGVLKVSLSRPLDDDTSYGRLAAGRPALWVIDPDDYVIDMKARTPSAVGYEGHRYRVPTEEANEMFGLRSDEKLTPSDREETLPDGNMRASALSRKASSDRTDYCDHSDLWELMYWPTREVLCFRTDVQGLPTPEEDGEPLYRQPWVGHRDGPYLRLEFAPVPANLVGIGPVMQLLMDLDELANQIFRKLQRQIRRLKKLVVYGRANEDDAEEIKKAMDGHMVGVTDVSQLKELIVGGIAPLLYEFFTAVQSLFNWFGGNVSLQAGVAPAAKTATQEKMLAAASNATVQSMQARVIEFASNAMERVAWYFWQDPVRVMELDVAPRSAPEYSRRARLYPFGSVDGNGAPRSMRRQIPFEQLELKVDPYSLQHRTPAEMAQELMEMIQQVFAPLAGLCQQQGVLLDMHEVFRLLAKYKSNPDLGRVLSLEKPQPQPNEAGAGVPESPGARPPTHSIYERTSSAGGEQDTQAAIIQSMQRAGRNGQPQESTA